MDSATYAESKSQVTVSGHVKRHDVRLCGTENPHVTREHINDSLNMVI